MSNPVSILTDVFRDTNKHRATAKIIRKFSSNKSDIREIALSKISFEGKRRILDLGCGFGFFTEALQNKIQPGTLVTGIDCFDEYREPFLEVCKNIGAAGEFVNAKADIISTFEPESFDLILCSYSIYFFPEVLPLLRSAIKPSGSVILIVHSSIHLKELSQLVLKFINESGYKIKNELPYNSLISNLNAENGTALLGAFFSKTIKIDFFNKLVFPQAPTKVLIDYFRFKRSFFIPQDLTGKYSLVRFIETQLAKKCQQDKGFKVNKNDAVFICENPVKKDS
jgi:SAM-dependent methyltransferase